MAVRIIPRGQTPAEAYDLVNKCLARIRDQTQAMKAQAQAGSVSLSDLYHGWIYVLANDRRTILALKDVPGLLAYARQQHNDPTYDHPAEVASLLAVVNATLTWARTNFPQDATGALRMVRLKADGSGDVEPVTVTAPAQLSALVTRFDAILAEYAA